MNHQVCIKGFKKYGSYTDVEIEIVLLHLERKKEFTPMEVANACGMGYARAVRIIDVLYELGFTDWPGFITPNRNHIKLLEVPRTSQELQQHKAGWQ